MDKSTCKFDACEAPIRAGGLCIGHYTQQLRGRPLVPIERPKDLEAYFWNRTTKADGCWEWNGVFVRAYGWINAFGYRGVAHRVSYMLHHGPIPDGMMVDHICHNKACVNPQHLRAATAKQNAEHRAGAQRNNTSSGVRGVYWHKQSKKWRAMVRHNQRLMSVGLFPTIAEAEAAVIAKRNELFTHNDVDRMEIAA